MLSQILLAYSDPIRQSRRHRATSPGHGLYARPSLCGSAEATHETFPTFPGALSPRAADLTPVGPLALPVSPGLSDTRLPRMTSESPPTSPSLPAIPDGGPFRGCIVRVMLRPVRLPGLLAGYNAVQERPTPRLLRYRVTPALGTGRRRAVLGVRLDVRRDVFD